MNCYVLQQRTCTNLVSAKFIDMKHNERFDVMRKFSFCLIYAMKTKDVCASGQARWCIMANPEVLTPISYEGEMRHTVPLYCHKSFFVDGWQLFIRSNLFKPPLRELTFSTLTHFAVYESHSWFALGRESEGICAHFHTDCPLCWIVLDWGRENREQWRQRSGSESIILMLHFPF